MKKATAFILSYHFLLTYPKLLDTKMVISPLFFNDFYTFIHSKNI